MAWDPGVPATTDKIKVGPSAFQDNWDAVEDWTEVEHYGLSYTSALSGHHVPEKCRFLFIGATADLPATNVACAAAYDTTLGVFKYSTNAAWVSVGGSIEAGTKMLFYADTAPVGWTLINTLDDKLVWVTKGSVAGGETGGGAHSTGTWTRTGHSHTIAAHDHTNATLKAADTTVEVYSFGNWYALGTYAHTHDITDKAFTTSTNADETAWRPAAYCFIICTKD